jgi:hypothetical protein
VPANTGSACHTPVMAPPAAPAQSVQQAILQALYALFLGGIITAFLVVGLTTFYPQPSFESPQIVELQQRQQAIYECPDGVGCEITPAEQAEIARIDKELEPLRAQQEQARQLWARNAGLILIAAATALLALSLVRWDRAIVLSNGMLLGGLFTMVGGIGLSIAGGEGVARFLVLSLALALTVGLGYLRFARRPADSTGPTAPGGPPAAGDQPSDVTELSGRVADLEMRMSDMRRALGG